MSKSRLLATAADGSGDLASTFQHPPSRYRGVTFWALNGSLEARELRRQIDVFREMGLGGACLHARSGLETPYLSRRWFDRMRCCVEHARARGLLIWLYDEDRYPSGAAGGLVTRNPEYRQKRLWMQVLTGRSREIRTAQEPIGYFAIVGSVHRPRSYRRIERASERSRGETVLAFHVQEAPANSWYNGFTYLDTMSKPAVQAFLRSTYAAYHRHLGRHFGRTIEAIFTDEPNRGPALTSFWGEVLAAYDPVERLELPWTARLPDQFRTRYGYDLLDHLPELYFDFPGESASVSRFHYFDLTTALFCEAFGKTLGTWCGRKKIDLVGHVLGEQGPSTQTSFAGAAMRLYPHLQIPGVDVLGADCREYDAVLQCASVANQMGKRWVMSETFGACGWNLTFADQKALGDWQSALGINRRCLHLAFYTMASAAKRDYPPSISFQSSWWRKYKEVEDYFARIAAVLSRGKPVRPVLVIHPVESTWLRFRAGWDRDGDVKRLDRLLEELRDNLLRANVSFDYGDENLLDRSARVVKTIDGPRLAVGAMRYEAVVVPEMLTMRATTVALLEAFRAAGGRIIWTGAAPAMVDARPSQAGRVLVRRCKRITVRPSAIRAALHHSLPVQLTGRRLAEPVLHQIRQDRRRTHLFLCNTNRKQRTGPLRVSVAASGQVQEWDPRTGEKFSVAQTQSKGGVHFACDLPPCGSALFVIDPQTTGSLPSRPRWRIARRRALPMPGWRYALDEPNPLVLDHYRLRIAARSWTPALEVLRADAWLRRQIGLPPRRYHEVQPWCRPPAPAEHTRVTVSAEFDVKTAEIPAIELAMERITGLRSVKVNDRPLSLNRDVGYWVDPCLRRYPIDSASLRQGRNEIRVEMNYSSDSGLESIYLLSHLGVRVQGKRGKLIDRPEWLQVGDVVPQGLPFYGAGFSYRRTITPRPRAGEALFLVLGRWSGCCADVRIDKREIGSILWPPCEIQLPISDDREHELDLRIYLGRANTFGPLHRLPAESPVVSPFDFATTGAAWQDAYSLQSSGLLSPPRLEYRRARSGVGRQG